MAKKKDNSLLYLIGGLGILGLGFTVLRPRTTNPNTTIINQPSKPTGQIIAETGISVLDTLFPNGIRRSNSNGSSTIPADIQNGINASASGTNPFILN